MDAGVGFVFDSRCRQLWPARSLTGAPQGSPPGRGFFPRANSSKRPELTGDTAKPHVFSCSSSHIALEQLCISLPDREQEQGQNSPVLHSALPSRLC